MPAQIRPRSASLFRADRLLYAAIAVTALVPAAGAQVLTSTWTGVTGNWTNPTIWSTNPNFPNNGTPPGASYTAVINGSGVITVDAPITIDQLSFSSGTVGAPTAGGARTLTMNSLTTWSGGTFGGLLTVNANGGAALSGMLELQGAALTLRGASTLSGRMTMLNGGQLINDTGATLVATGGGLDTVAGAVPAFLNRGTFRVAGNVSITSTGSTGAIDVQSGVLTLSPSGGGGGSDTTASGPVTVATGAQITVQNPGILRITGPGGVFRGTGTVAGPATLALVAGAALAPGVGGPGVLHAIGPVTMAAGATFQADLTGPAAGAGYDQLDLSGGGTIRLDSPSLSTLLGYAPSPADVLTIVSGGQVTGTFAGLSNGATFMVGSFGGTQYFADITYTSNSVLLSNLRPVPEPAAWLLAGGAAAIWLRRRRSAAA